ncbi:hypothetical protein BJX65DRAFT_301054 [Aspergillus insuetus]
MDKPTRLFPVNVRSGSGFKYYRAGGAQLPSPRLGYVSGQLQGRFMSFLSNYRTSRATRARFQLLVQPVGGRQCTGQHKNPGGGGNWAPSDDFIGQVIAFIKNNNMQDGLELDFWNEPDSTVLERKLLMYRSIWNKRLTGP